MERIALSQRERDRLKVLHEVQQKQLTQVAAAERFERSCEAPQGVIILWKSVPGAHMRQLIVVLKTLFMAACALVVFGTITLQLRKLDHFAPMSLPSWMRFAGVVLMAAGALLGGGCFGLFASGGALSPGPTFPDPEVFISRGPYNFVRNPMGLGGLTVLLGWGLYKLSVTTVIFAVVMAGLMHLFVMRVEEPKLERRLAGVTGATRIALTVGSRADEQPLLSSGAACCVLL